LTVWLTPYEMRALEALQRDRLPEGAQPRPAGRVLAEALLRDYSARNDRDERDVVAAPKKRTA
jgi:hypothetical protein